MKWEGHIEEHIQVKSGCVLWCEAGTHSAKTSPWAQNISLCSHHLLAGSRCGTKNNQTFMAAGIWEACHTHTHTHVYIICPMFTLCWQHSTKDVVVVSWGSDAHIHTYTHTPNCYIHPGKVLMCNVSVLESRKLSCKKNTFVCYLSWNEVIQWSLSLWSTNESPCICSAMNATNLVSLHSMHSNQKWSTASCVFFHRPAVGCSARLQSTATDFSHGTNFCVEPRTVFRKREGNKSISTLYAWWKPFGLKPFLCRLMGQWRIDSQNTVDQGCAHQPRIRFPPMPVVLCQSLSLSLSDMPCVEAPEVKGFSCNTGLGWAKVLTAATQGLTLVNVKDSWPSCLSVCRSIPLATL